MFRDMLLLTSGLFLFCFLLRINNQAKIIFSRKTSQYYALHHLVLFILLSAAGDCSRLVWAYHGWLIPGCLSDYLDKDMHVIEANETWVLQGCFGEGFPYFQKGTDDRDISFSSLGTPFYKFVMLQPSCNHEGTHLKTIANQWAWQSERWREHWPLMLSLNFWAKPQTTPTSRFFVMLSQERIIKTLT